MSLVDVNQHGGVVRFTLNTPPANASSHWLHKQFDHAIPAARRDPAAHAIVRTSAGQRFFRTDAAEGLAAFNAKRSPRFQGR